MDFAKAFAKYHTYIVCINFNIMVYSVMLLIGFQIF